MRDYSQGRRGRGERTTCMEASCCCASGDHRDHYRYRGDRHNGGRGRAGNRGGPGRTAIGWSHNWRCRGCCRFRSARHGEQFVEQPRCDGRRWAGRARRLHYRCRWRIHRRSGWRWGRDTLPGCIKGRSNRCPIWRCHDLRRRIRCCDPIRHGRVLVR